ncbi:MAG TPA: hypothetical protein DCK93_20610 [Blastocatellia bacterium]|jgi:hypothetical protein|nr:hypothetical protein [Blastocatellia bacterium]HAF25276.1 hypothetical protein [Blastocatellia bacterium]
MKDRRLYSIPLEAEAVAMLCCEALNLEGGLLPRLYPHWLYQGIGYNAEAIPEKSAQKILRSADQILRAGAYSRSRTTSVSNDH